MNYLYISLIFVIISPTIIMNYKDKIPFLAIENASNSVGSEEYEVIITNGETINLGDDTDKLEKR
jgi:hypothetical protein